MGKKRSEELSLFEESDPPELEEPSEPNDPREPDELDDPSDPSEPRESDEPKEPRDPKEPKDSEEDSEPMEGPKELDPESDRVDRGPEPEDPIWNISLGLICFLCALSVDNADEAEGL